MSLPFSQSPLCLPRQLILGYLRRWHEKNSIHCCPLVQQCTRERMRFQLVYRGRMDNVDSEGWPGCFLSSGLLWKRDARLGFTSNSCCVSLGRTLKTAWRSPFSFWQALAESTPPFPDWCNYSKNCQKLHQDIRSDTMLNHTHSIIGLTA